MGNGRRATGDGQRAMKSVAAGALLLGTAGCAGERFEAAPAVTPPAPKITLGRWHYTVCQLGHSSADLPESSASGVAQPSCTGNGAGLSFTLLRRSSGDTVDIHVHEGCDGLDGPTYRRGVVGQVRAPRGRAIHLVRSSVGEAEPLEEQRYLPLR
jgi:hypothetical protein